jgi:hypothetical protein
MPGIKFNWFLIYTSEWDFLLVCLCVIICLQVIGFFWRQNASMIGNWRNTGKTVPSSWARKFNSKSNISILKVLPVLSMILQVLNWVSTKHNINIGLIVIDFIALYFWTYIFCIFGYTLFLIFGQYQRSACKWLTIFLYLLV